MDSAVRRRPRRGFVASTISRYSRMTRPSTRPFANASLCVLDMRGVVALVFFFGVFFVVGIGGETQGNGLFEP